MRFVPPENWHVTLRFLGECDPAAVAEAIDGAVLTPTVARLGPAVDVIDGRLLAIPVTGVDDLAARIGRATANIGEPPQKRFAGHLTVARMKSGSAMPSTLGALVDAEFDVREIDLVQSRLEPTGARYESLHTWHLA